MGVLKRAVEDVEGKKKWMFIAMRYEELAKDVEDVGEVTIGQGSAKRFWEEGKKKRKFKEMDVAVKDSEEKEEENDETDMGQKKAKLETVEEEKE